MRWRVGNGKYIKIGEDSWLGEVNGFKPVLVRKEMSEAYVSTLIDEIGNWKENFIKESFIPSDVEAISNIPLGNLSSKDEIICGPEAKGSFTVKSAYF